MKNSIGFSKSAGAFSALEVLVVLTIISMLTAILLPVFQQARLAANKTTCASNLRQFGVAFRLYQRDHGGTYPLSWRNNSDHWQSYLCGSYAPWSPVVGTRLATEYLPAAWCIYAGPPTYAKRIEGRLVCPTMVKKYRIPLTGPHDQWGYCYNASRVDISYNAHTWPYAHYWTRDLYLGQSLDTLYPNASKSSIMACGNASSYGLSNPLAPSWAWEIAIVPTHNEYVNTLFMDGRVVPLRIGTTREKYLFDYYWRNGIPTSSGILYAGYTD